MTQSVVERAQRLIAPLQELYNQARMVDQSQAEQRQQIEPIFQASAYNLLHLKRDLFSLTPLRARRHHSDGRS